MWWRRVGKCLVLCKAPAFYVKFTSIGVIRVDLYKSFANCYGDLGKYIFNRWWLMNEKFYLNALAFPVWYLKHVTT